MNLDKEISATYGGVGCECALSARQRSDVGTPFVRAGGGRLLRSRIESVGLAGAMRRDDGLANRAEDGGDRQDPADDAN